MKLKRAPVLPEQSRRQKASILIVDDDANKLIALRSVLESLGENIVEARSGTDALRNLLRGEFAVILLDVRMPIMNGFETAEMIRQRPSSELTPIIFVTALDQAETDMGRGYELGAVDFVFAPVVPSILRAKVSVFVELYKAQHELKRYRDQLQGLVQERTAALTAINRELESFHYVVTHDLKGPLASLETSTKHLVADADKLDAPTRHQVERLRQSSRRLSELFSGIQTLFSLTRSELRRERLDLSRFAREILDGLRAREPERDVDAVIEPELAVDGDARLVRVLLTNLIDNAWKFTRNEARPRIEVGKETVAGETRIFVRDNGVGFDMIYAHRLFGAFQRLHSHSEFPGEGIGLAAAQRIVNRHGGRIWAEGALGEGAAFFFVV
ncbi:MAG TPA: response regulator [Candidatus Dormibacteraeota bacterium]|nr:response regulator [Candidatus Dormibacteraeota bacterium]